MGAINVLGHLFPAASKQRGLWGKIVYNSPLYFPQPSPRLAVNAQVDAHILQSFLDEEGERLDVYRDHLGHLTVGIGHLVTPLDGLKFGQVITQAQSRAFFKKDIKVALDAAKEQAAELNKYDEDFIIALAHVNFQLGEFWRSKFPNTWSALKNGNWRVAINNLKASAWARQTPQRVANFIGAIQDVYG